MERATVEENVRRELDRIGEVLPQLSDMQLSALLTVLRSLKPLDAPRVM